MTERLQKLISRAGICSRRAAETLLTEGRVTVNGMAAQLGDKADPETDAALWSELRTEYSGLRAERENETQMYPANAFIGKALRMLLLDRYGLKEELIAELRAVYAPMAALTGTLWENLTTCASCNHGFASIIGQLLLKNA